jgi:hypothetical protein
MRFRAVEIVAVLMEIRRFFCSPRIADTVA